MVLSEEDEILIEKLGRKFISQYLSINELNLRSFKLNIVILITAHVNCLHTILCNAAGFFSNPSDSFTTFKELILKYVNKFELTDDKIIPFPLSKG